MARLNCTDTQSGLAHSTRNDTWCQDSELNDWGQIHFHADWPLTHRPLTTQAVQKHGQRAVSGVNGLNIPDVDNFITQKAHMPVKTNFIKGTSDENILFNFRVKGWQKD